MSRALRSRGVAVVVLAWFALVFAGLWANLIAGILLALPDSVQLTNPATRQLRGHDVASFSWPSWTPVPWPAPTSADLAWTPGRTTMNIFAERPIEQASPRRNNFQMQVERYGWPMPLVQHSQRWWDWDDASLVPAGKDRRALAGRYLEVLWVGMLVPPIVLASVVVGAFAVPGVLVRRFRRRRSRCESCGYPIGASAVCTECGVEVGGDGGGAVIVGMPSRAQSGG
jgi:hypothetical protein